jgi:hypothetical protein
LLLDGIPDFYARFGYVDIYDATVHAITWKSALDGSPPSLCRVRPATLEDAPALLDLYLRHYGRYPGRFERTLEQQAYWLRWSHPEQAPQLAIAPDGSVCGYLTLRHWQPASVKAREVAADDWPAALALLQHHAHTFDGQPEASAELLWPLPTDSATYFTLADHLPLHTRVEVQPNEGWQARPARLSELFRSLLPWWQALWRRQALQWKGHLGIRIEDEESSADSEACLLALSSGHVEMVAAPPAESVAWVRLSPGTFIQLLFGYRPVEWAASQPGREVPHELRPVMAALFEGERFWIPGTDTF